jgi:hypothetical protein
LIDPTDSSTLHVLTYGYAFIFGQWSGPFASVNHGTITKAGVYASSGATIPDTTVGSDGIGTCTIENGQLFVPRDDWDLTNPTVWVADLPVSSFSMETLPIDSEVDSIIITGNRANSGNGYAVGDTGTIDGGSLTNPTIYEVTGEAGGVITGITFVFRGGGYSVGLVTTTPGYSQPGSGSGFTYNITSVSGGTVALGEPHVNGIAMLVVDPDVIILTDAPVTGYKPLAPKPNPFDLCLAREFRLFQDIDYTLLTCGKKPACFCTDPREWGMPTQ